MMYLCDCDSDYNLFEFYSFFFFNDTATTEIYTLSLHDALPICCGSIFPPRRTPAPCGRISRLDRKSTRLNSSHANISYAVFCLKKKNYKKKRFRKKSQQDKYYAKRLI